jgi:hypothetical protein
VITDATAANPKGSCESVQRRAPRAADSRSEDKSQSQSEREEKRKS